LSDDPTFDRDRHHINEGSLPICRRQRPLGVPVQSQRP
jgi:hypothetical protein